MPDIHQVVSDIVRKHAEQAAAEVTAAFKAATVGLFNGVSVSHAPQTVSVAPARPPAPTVNKKSATAPAKRHAPGVKRDEADINALKERLLSHITAMPGQRVEEIGKALSVTTKEVTLPLKKLHADGKITRSGEKRATQYFPKG